MPTGGVRSMLIERRKRLTANIGLFGVGHDTYWHQFEGLKDELLGYHGEMEKIIKNFGVEVFNFGMVDNAETTYNLVKKLKGSDLDVIFCNMLTYATSSTWGIIAREMDVPIVLL